MNVLNRFANWKFILPLFVAFLSFPLFFFDHYQSKITATAGSKLKILDVRFNYSFDDVNGLFAAMGNEGREIYSIISGKVDMVFPIVNSLLLMLILFNLLKKVNVPNSKWLYLSLLPILGGFFDFLENFNILNLLNSYPNITQDQVAMASLITSMKWFSSALVIGLIVVLIVTVLRKKMKRNSAPDKLTEMNVDDQLN
ncbi:MAG: hypothetical protein ACJASQ_000557 [Crocinitomicaceae bacterium]|jgi:hypothetical protein